MAGASAKVVAMLLSVLATYGFAAGVVYTNDWLPAKATWYGQPNGAGPDDNGTACDIFARFSSSSPTICCFFPAMWLTKS